MLSNCRCPVLRRLILNAERRTIIVPTKDTRQRNRLSLYYYGCSTSPTQRWLVSEFEFIAVETGDDGQHLAATRDISIAAMIRFCEERRVGDPQHADDIAHDERRLLREVESSQASFRAGHTEVCEDLIHSVLTHDVRAAEEQLRVFRPLLLQPFHVAFVQLHEVVLEHGAHAARRVRAKRRPPRYCVHIGRESVRAHRYQTCRDN